MLTRLNRNRNYRKDPIYDWGPWGTLVRKKYDPTYRTRDGLSIVRSVELVWWWPVNYVYKVSQAVLIAPAQHILETTRKLVRRG